MTTLYLIQTNKPRSQTGTNPIPIFFGLFIVETVRKRKATVARGTLILSSQKNPDRYVSESVSPAPQISLFRSCVASALATFGTEPCAGIRKKIAKIAGDVQGDADTLEGLLDEKGYSFSVIDI